MPVVNNLRSCIWEDSKIHGADLYSSRSGLHATHWIGVQEVVSFDSDMDVNPRYVRHEDRIALDQRGLILVGNLNEFNPETARLARTSGSPTRLELIGVGCGYEVVDFNHGLGPTTIAKANEHVGVIYRSNSVSFPSRSVLHFFGTSPIGVLAGVRLAMHCGLAAIPAPPGFPNRPIEALVPVLQTDGTEPPSISDLGGVRVFCGDMEWDSHRHEWVKTIGETKIRVLTRGGVARVIFVGKKRFEVNQSDFSRLLLLFIERSAINEWTTIREAQLNIDGAVLKSRDRTLNNRKAQIANISPNLLEKTKETSDGSLGYRISVPIHFVEQTE